MSPLLYAAISCGAVGIGVFALMRALGDRLPPPVPGACDCGACTRRSAGGDS